MDKQSLRLKHLKLRRSLSAETHQRLSALIFKALLSDLESYEHIGVYISMTHEVDTRTIIAWCFEHHKHVYVPKVIRDELVFVPIRSLAECSMNRWGILEPIAHQVSATIEVMIVPVLAFNARRHRLGYGKAYYDRYLRAYDGVRIGVCYEANFECELFETSTDMQLDKIVTECGVV